MMVLLSHAAAAIAEVQVRPMVGIPTAVWDGHKFGITLCNVTHVIRHVMLACVTLDFILQVHNALLISFGPIHNKMFKKAHFLITNV